MYKEKTLIAPVTVEDKDEAKRWTLCGERALESNNLDIHLLASSHYLCDLG